MKRRWIAMVAGAVVLVLVLSPRRSQALPAEQSTNPVSCEGEAHVPCYVVGWFIPLGRLPAGQHRLYAEAYPIGDIFVGWTTYSGVYFSWDETFTVVAPAPPAP